MTLFFAGVDPTPIKLTGLQCTGYEDILHDCPKTHAWEDTAHCSHSDDVSIQCYTDTGTGT